MLAIAFATRPIANSLGTLAIILHAYVAIALTPLGSAVNGPLNIAGDTKTDNV